MDTLFLLALGTAGVVYGAHIHTAGVVAIAGVLAVFCVAAAYALYGTYIGRIEVRHIELAANICPAIGIAGVASGFLIALSAGTEDIQQRVVGASSGLAATVIAVACMVVLDCQAHMLKTVSKNTQCACGSGNPHGRIVHRDPEDDSGFSLP